jgi:hypothetical protein
MERSGPDFKLLSGVEVEEQYQVKLGQSFSNLETVDVIVGTKEPGQVADRISKFQPRGLSPYLKSALKKWSNENYSKLFKNNINWNV